MKLLLPLKYYDDAGRVKPPSAVYYAGLFLCRSLLVLIGALSSRQYGNELLMIFYQKKSLLYINLGIALPAFLALVVIGFREKIWSAQFTWVFGFIRPSLLLACLADFMFNLMLAYLQHWQFSWPIAITLMLNLLCLYYLYKDKHLIYMVQDWRRNESLQSP